MIGEAGQLKKAVRRLYQAVHALDEARKIFENLDMLEADEKISLRSARNIIEQAADERSAANIRGCNHGKT